MNAILAALGLAALFLGWNAPNHYPPWTAFHLEFFAAVGIALLGLAAYTPTGLRGPGGPAAPTRVVAFPMAARVWLAAGLLPLAQLACGQLDFRGDALIGLLYAAGVAFSLHIGQLRALQVGRARFLRQLWLLILAAGITATGLALVQWLHLPNPGWWAMELIDDRPYANFAQPNHLGLLLVWALVALVALFETGQVQQRSVLALAGGFLGLGVLMSQSRASALALLSLAVCWALTRHRVPSRLRGREVLGGVAAWLLLAFALPGLKTLLLLTVTAASPVTDVGPRQAIWLHFWAAIRERPWWGHGFNQAVRAMAEVATQVEPSRNVVSAHNFLLDLMTWAGIPMGLALCAALLVWIFSLLRRQDADAQGGTQRHLVFGLWLALLIQSLLEYPFAHAYFLLPAALLTGAVASNPAVQADPDRAHPARGTRSVQLLAAATLGLSALLASEYFQLEDDFRQARFDHAQVGTRHPHASLRQPWVLDQLAALNASADVVIGPGMAPADLALLQRLARRFHILSTRLDFARALALNGRLPEAQAEMRVIRSVLPASQYARVDRDWQAWLVLQGLQRTPTADADRP